MPSGHSKYIVFGEDDLDDEELLKELFESVDTSFDLVFINNGKQVIDFLQAAPPNALPCLIILDYNMPGSNGAVQPKIETPMAATTIATQTQKAAPGEKR